MNFKSTQAPAVSIRRDDTGNHITVSENNPEYGWIILEQNKTVIGPNNWVKPGIRTVQIMGEVMHLQAMGLEDVKTLPGKIVIKESLKPTNTNDPERNLKIAGSTGIVCKGVDPETGEVLPIYRISVYDSTNKLEDQLIPHINGDEIREANANQQTSTTRRNKVVSEEVDVVEENSEEVEVETDDDQFEL